MNIWAPPWYERARDAWVKRAHPVSPCVATTDGRRFYGSRCEEDYCEAMHKMHERGGQ